MERSRYKVALLDLDGTLTDPFEGISNAVYHALDVMGVSRPSVDVMRLFIGPPLTYSFKNYCGMSAADADRAVALYREYYSRQGIFELTVYDGVIEMLARLCAAGIKLYTATSKPEPFAKKICDKFGFGEYLDGVCGASFDSSRAEKDKVIEYALAVSGAKPSETVMVGDRKYDVEGAKRFSLASVGVLYGYGTREELVIAGADMLAETPIAAAELIIGVRA